MFQLNKTCGVKHGSELECILHINNQNQINLKITDSMINGKIHGRLETKTLYWQHSIKW